MQQRRGRARALLWRAGLVAGVAVGTKGELQARTRDALHVAACKGRRRGSYKFSRCRQLRRGARGIKWTGDGSVKRQDCHEGSGRRAIRDDDQRAVTRR